MVWSPEFDGDIRYSFTSFCQERLEPDDSFWGGRHDSLLGYINAWLRQDEGIRWTGGDYTAYLHAILIIIDLYDKDPSILHYKGPASGYLAAERAGRRHPPPEERRVQRILDLEDWGKACLDPRVYRKVLRGDPE